jgi:hypothetical protein
VTRQERSRPFRARSLAAQFVAGPLHDSWVYLAGPLLGAAIAVLVHDLLGGPPTRGAQRTAKGR